MSWRLIAISLLLLAVSVRAGTTYHGILSVDGECDDPAFPDAIECYSPKEDYGDITGCFAPTNNENDIACCGCVGSTCYACKSRNLCPKKVTQTCKTIPSAIVTVIACGCMVPIVLTLFVIFGCFCTVGDSSTTVVAVPSPTPTPITATVQTNTASALSTSVSADHTAEVDYYEMVEPETQHTHTPLYSTTSLVHRTSPNDDGSANLGAGQAFH